jgi:hypothetical protein
MQPPPRDEPPAGITQGGRATYGPFNPGIIGTSLNKTFSWCVVCCVACKKEGTHVYTLCIGSELGLWSLETPSKCYLVMKIFPFGQLALF